MNTALHNFHLVVGSVIAISFLGCVSPRPRDFIDADTLPPDFAGREHRAVARGQQLIIEVSLAAGFNVVGFDAFEQDGAVYVSPRHISSGASGKAKFVLDLSDYHLRTDWWDHVYWLLQSYTYPIGHPGFWSSEKRSPWPRMKMEIVKQ